MKLNKNIKITRDMHFALSKLPLKDYIALPNRRSNIDGKSNFVFIKSGNDIYSFNLVGSIIIDCFSRNYNTEQILEVLMTVFNNTPKEKISMDLSRLVDFLLEKGIVSE